MQTIVCWFLFVFKVLMYPPVWKVLSEPAGFSSLFRTARPLGEILIHYPTASLLSARHLAVCFTQHCTETVLNGPLISELNDFFQPAFLPSFVCNIYTIEHPFLDSAPTYTLKIVSSAITVNAVTSLSPVFEIHVQMCSLRYCLQNAS